MGLFVILTPGFPENELDSSCLPAVQKFVLSLKKLANEHRLVVISFQYPYKAKNYNWHGIEVIAIGGRNRTKLWRLFTWIKVYHQLSLLKKKNNFIGLLSLWLGECAFVGNYFSKRNYLKHFIWIHGQDAKVNNRYVSRIKPKATQLIAISSFIKGEFYKNHGISPSIIAENGIDLSDFPELNVGLRTIDIIGVGSLKKLKNYTLFIECIKELKKDHPQLSAVIVGEGEEKEMLQSLINTYELQDTIKLLGAKSHAVVLELLNQSKLFLHTSIYEGNSSALIEALYSGCQVISSCELGPEKLNHFYDCQTKEEMLSCLKSLIKTETTIKRVLFNNMESSAEKIFKLYH